MKARVDVNQVILLGTVAADPDVGKTANDELVAHFALSTKRPAPEHGVNWHRITAHHELAHFVEKNVRGRHRLFIEGYLEYGSYDRDGLTIPTTDIIAKEIINLTEEGL